MATIATLAANLKLNTNPFTKNVQAAQKRLKALQSTAVETVKKVAKIGTALSVASAGGLAFFTAKAFKSIDATAKMADVLGLTTKQLSSYHLAAELSGIGNDELTSSLRRMLKTVSDANEGLSTAKRSFATLGLDETRIKTLSTHEAFGKILDGLARIPNVFDRARVAQELFGRSGVKLIKLAQDGAGGLARVTREAEALGITFSRIDARQIENANDAITRVKAAFRGIFVQLAPKIANVVTPIANTFSDWAKNTDLAKRAAGGIFSALKKIGTTALDLFDAARVSAMRMIAAMIEGTQRLIKDSPIGLLFKDSTAAKIGATERAIAEVERKLKLKQPETIVKRGGKVISRRSSAENRLALVNELDDLRRNLKQLKSESLAGFAESLRKQANDIENGPLSADKLAVLIKKNADAARLAIQQSADARENAKKLGQAFDFTRNKVLGFFGKLPDPKAAEKAIAVSKLQAALGNLKTFGGGLLGGAGKVGGALGRVGRDFNDAFNFAIEKAQNRVAPVQFAGAAERGSAEAFSAITRAKFGDPTKVAMKQRDDQLKEQRKANRHLKKIARNQPKVARIRG